MQIYIARFPLSNEINTTKTDSSVALKAAVKNASDYNDVDVCTSTAGKSGHIMFISLCNSLNSNSFTVGIGILSKSNIR